MRNLYVSETKTGVGPDFSIPMSYSTVIPSTDCKFRTWNNCLRCHLIHRHCHRDRALCATRRPESGSYDYLLENGKEKPSSISVWQITKAALSCSAPLSQIHIFRSSSSNASIETASGNRGVILRSYGAGLLRSTSQQSSTKCKDVMHTIRSRYPRTFLYRSALHFHPDHEPVRESLPRVPWQ